MCLVHSPAVWCSEAGAVCGESCQGQPGWSTEENSKCDPNYYSWVDLFISRLATPIKHSSSSPPSSRNPRCTKSESWRPQRRGCWRWGRRQRLSSWRSRLFSWRWRSWRKWSKHSSSRWGGRSRGCTATSWGLLFPEEFQCIWFGFTVVSGGCLLVYTLQYTTWYLCVCVCVCVYNLLGFMSAMRKFQERQLTWRSTAKWKQKPKSECSFLNYILT